MATEPQLYLIAHKVTGELAFDIAHKLPIGEEEGWIIPTSGHRAYPLATWLLEDLADVSDYPHARPAEFEGDLESVPDHYETKADLRRAQEADLFSALGFKRAAPVIVNRRI